MVGDVIVVVESIIGESAEGESGVLTGRNVEAMITDGGGYVCCCWPEDETGWKRKSALGTRG